MLFAAELTFWQNFAQQTLDGLAFGALIALIALGYTMVYGIVELINFAHGDLFMLGTLLCLTIVGAFGLGGGLFSTVTHPDPSWGHVTAVLLCALLAAMILCGAMNFTVDWLVYKPLRTAPKLAPLVSAIGVSFVFMNIGLFWGGPQDLNFPQLIGNKNLLGEDSWLRFTGKELLIFAVTIPLMIGLTAFIKYSKLGKAMRATAQNPVAAKLMGINTNMVIGLTFAIGGALAGAASLVYALKVNTVNYQIGFQNGLYAFTAAVLGGIGRIPGAVLGGIIIGLVRYYGSAYINESWVGAIIFGILIIILIFRPTGLLGSTTREKV
jgi:branched-chain amino acid transport system permease protein